MGNKSDKLAERKISTQEGYDLAKSLECLFLETSAKKNINVEKAFSDVAKIVHNLSYKGMFQDVASSESSSWGSWIGKEVDWGCCIIM